MDVMLHHLDRAQSSLDAGDVKSAMAWTEAVMMDRQEKVYLDLSCAGNQSSTAANAFKGALQMWLDSLPNAADLLFVKSESEADVVVRFNPQVVSEGLNVAGNIQWSRSIVPYADGQVRASVKAVIQVRTERPGSNQPMSFELMRHTCAHEIGHLLGLGDSYRVGDLMGPLDLRAPVSKLSETELQAMREMRDQASRIRGIALLSAAGR